MDDMSEALNDASPGWSFNEVITFSPECDLEPRTGGSTATAAGDMQAVDSILVALHQESNESMLSLMPRGHLRSESSDLSIEFATREENSGPRPTKSASTQEWEMHREIIKDLYLNNGMPLKEVVAYMTERLNFHATARTYKTRFNQWGCNKYIKSCDMASPVEKAKSQASDRLKVSDFEFCDCRKDSSRI